jgi:hypothetical protein
MKAMIADLGHGPAVRTEHRDFREIWEYRYQSCQRATGSCAAGMIERSRMEMRGDSMRKNQGKAHT